MTAPTGPLADLSNLGEKSAELLREVGIETPEALREAGAVFAYKILKHRFPKSHTLLSVRDGRSFAGPALDQLYDRRKGLLEGPGRRGVRGWFVVPSSQIQPFQN